MDKLISKAAFQACQDVFFQKEYLTCLLMRLQLIRENYSQKSDFEKNEIRITELDTRLKIIRIQKSLQLNEDFARKELLQYVWAINNLREYEQVVEMFSGDISPDLLCDYKQEKNAANQVTILKSLCERKNSC